MTILSENTETFELKKREILEQVVLETGVPMTAARRVLDTALSICHQGLQNGEQIALHPLGRIRIIDRDTEKGRERIYKLVLQKR